MTALVCRICGEIPLLDKTIHNSGTADGFLRASFNSAVPIKCKCIFESFD